MGTRTLPSPARYRDQLRAELAAAGLHPAVQVTPRAEDGTRTAAWTATFYEVAAYWPAMGTDLGELEAALTGRPEVARTARVTGYPATITGDWPGWRRRRDRATLRPQVLAMARDPEGT